MRYLRVRDQCKDLAFVPTSLQKADGLTKLECSVPQRRLLLHNVADPIIEYEYSDDEDYGYESEHDDSENNKNCAHVCYTSGLLY